MHRLRKLSLTLLVWLTAAMTVVAGTHHLTCTCPDGRANSDRVASTEKKTGCCCCGRCCGHAAESGINTHPGRHLPRKTCCGDHAKKAVRSAQADRLVRSSCCTKVPASSDPAVPSASDGGLPKSVTFGLPTAAGASPSRHAARVGRCRRQGHERPPPTDRVIVLQHFLI